MSTTKRVKDKIAAAVAFEQKQWPAGFKVVNPYHAYLPSVKDLTEIVEIEDTMPVPKSKEEAVSIFKQAAETAERTKDKKDFIRAGIARNDMWAITNPGWNPSVDKYQKYLYPGNGGRKTRKTRKGSRVSRKSRTSRKGSRKTRKH